MNNTGQDDNGKTNSSSSSGMPTIIPTSQADSGNISNGSNVIQTPSVIDCIVSSVIVCMVSYGVHVAFSWPTAIHFIITVAVAAAVILICVAVPVFVVLLGVPVFVLAATVAAAALRSTMCFCYQTILFFVGGHFMCPIMTTNYITGMSTLSLTISETVQDASGKTISFSNSGMSTTSRTSQDDSSN